MSVYTEINENLREISKSSIEKKNPSKQIKDTKMRHYIVAWQTYGRPFLIFEKYIQITTVMWNQQCRAEWWPHTYTQ